MSVHLRPARRSVLRLVLGGPLVVLLVGLNRALCQRDGLEWDDLVDAIIGDETLLEVVVRLLAAAAPTSDVSLEGP